MATARRTGGTAARGAAVVVLGVLVLRSPGAQAGFGWFAYGPPSPEDLDHLVAWNLTREVGAVLVLVGLLVLAHLLGALASATRGAAAGRLSGRVLALGAVLVVGGSMAFFALSTTDRGEEVVTISKFVRPPQIMAGPGVWTREQLAAALVVATGLVVGAVSVGLRGRRTR